MAENEKPEKTENEKPEKTENEKPEKAENEKPAEKSAKKELDNFVFVGKKPAMSYVLAVVTQFTNGMSEVHIRARGKSISRAVDVAEIVKNRFMKRFEALRVTAASTAFPSLVIPSDIKVSSTSSEISMVTVGAPVSTATTTAF